MATLGPLSAQAVTENTKIKFHTTCPTDVFTRPHRLLCEKPEIEGAVI